MEKTQKQETREAIILDLIDTEVVEKSDGSYKTECPHCGLQGGRTKGFIVWPEDNRWYCHSSRRHGGLLELVALKHELISCQDCLETDEKRTVLEGDLFKETLDTLKAEYGDEINDRVLDVIKLRTRIELPDQGKLRSKFAAELAYKVGPKEILFYRSDTRQIVEIGKIKHPNKEIEYSGFVPVDSGRFITLMEKFFKPWAKVYTKSGTVLENNKSMSSSVANVVMVSDDFRDAIPIITNIYDFPLPIIYNSELTFPKKGYDSRFGSFLSYSAPEITEPNMSLEEAKKVLSYIYQDFCYQGEQDRTNDIASLITPFCRGLYQRETCRTPLFLRKANRERAGKDYDEGVRSIVYEGAAVEESPISNGEKGASNNNDELRKKITAALMEGKKKLHFANNRGKLDNAVLEAVLTNEHYSDRKLGSNTTIRLPNTLEFSASGNVGVTMTPDLLNRSRTINLFLVEEDANARTFAVPDLHGWVKDNRSKILSALYSLVRNWKDKGSPDGSVPFASYPEWARVVGGIMEAAGYSSPCVPDKEMLGISVDTETADMKNLFEMIYEKIGEKFLRKDEIKELIKEQGDGLFADYEWDKKADQIKFGVLLNKFVGRILSDIRLDVRDRNIRTQRWEYKFVKEKATYVKKEPISLDLHENNIKSSHNPENDGHDGHDCHVLSTPENAIRKGIIKSSQTMPNIAIMTKPIKTDREVQFFEAKECDEIKPKCTKEEIIEYLSNNPESTSEDLYNKFGVGSLKLRNEILKEKLK